MPQPCGGQHLRIAQVDGVGVAAIGVDHQGAVAPGQWLADSPRRATACFGAGTNSADTELLTAIDITVIGQYVANRLRGRHLITGDVAVVTGKRRIIGPLNHHIQACYRFGAGGVAHAVGENFAQGLSCCAQGLDHRIVVVQYVLIAAIGIEHQLAITPRQRLACEGDGAGFTGH
ncbi:hypothetical protein D3C79_807040 [compost metagenome]